MLTSPKNCWNLQKSTFILILSQIQLEKSFLVISEILGLLLNNMLTAHDKYSYHNDKNLPLPMQMQLYCIFGIYIKYFKKKNVLKSLAPKDVVTWMHKGSYFWKPFSSQLNESQKLLKSAEKHFYPIFSSFWAKLS